MEKEELTKRMDRIIEWVKACDTKASIMLALIGVMISVLYSTDATLKGVVSILSSWVRYEGHCVSDVSISGTLCIIGLIGAIYTTCGAMFRLVMVLYSKTDERVEKDNWTSYYAKCWYTLFLYSPQVKPLKDTISDSLIHFHHLSTLDMDTFQKELKKDTYQEENDILSQVLINAHRCNEKFHDYNAGIRWMLASVPFFILYFVSLVFYMTTQIS